MKGSLGVVNEVKAIFFFNVSENYPEEDKTIGCRSGYGGKEKIHLK